MAKFYPPDPGGIEHAVATLSEGLAARGHQVRVVAAQGLAERDRPYKLRQTADPPAVQRAAAVDVRRIHTFGIWWSQPVAPGYVPASWWRADVIHVHHPHPLADAAVLFGAGRRGLRRAPAVVVTHHAEVRRQRLAAPFYQPLVRGVLRRARGVVVATRSHLRIATELKRSHDKCHVIPYGIDPRPFHREDAIRSGVEWRERWGHPQRVVMAVGRLVWYKGLDFLLKANVALDTHVVIVGHGPERQALDDVATRLGIRERVHFTGYVPSAALPGLYQASDVVVLASVDRAEMFGITLLEGMASGKPIVTTQLDTGVSEVNVPGETGLEVPPGNASALADAIQTLVENPSRAREMGERGRTRVRACYALDHMVDRHEGLYTSITQQQGRDA